MQGFYCQEEGDKKMNAHIQAEVILMLASYDGAHKDLAAPLRLMCGFETGDEHKWAISVGLHPHELAAQSTLRKLTGEGLFAYCAKQRYHSAIYRCASSCLLPPVLRVEPVLFCA